MDRPSRLLYAPMDIVWGAALGFFFFLLLPPLSPAPPGCGNAKHSKDETTHYDCRGIVNIGMKRPTVVAFVFHLLHYLRYFDFMRCHGFVAAGRRIRYSRWVKRARNLNVSVSVDISSFFVCVCVTC